ncbi:DUF4837 family protein [candidate division TA06 bacterium]|nr:DUF4837 family protein [candidate division TA06 bacterium]
MKNGDLRIVNFSFIIQYSLFTILSVLACQSSREAAGREDKVIVVCEDLEWRELESLISEILEKEEPFSLEGRNFFDVERIRPNDFDLYRYRKNLFLMGVLETTPLISQLLTGEAQEEVLSKKAQVFEKRDAWAKGQSMLIVTAENQDALINILKSHGEIIHRFFVGEVSKRTRERLYHDGFEVDLALRFKHSYGWSIHVPKGYKIAREDSSGRFVQLIRHFPDRLISVYWEKIDERSAELRTPNFEFRIPDEEECLNLRDSLALKYFEGDQVTRERVQSEEVNFQGRKALRLMGYWENEEKVMGGPFLAYCFIQGGRLYLLDFHLFAPGKKKWLYLLQLEEISKTFEVEDILHGERTLGGPNDIP